MAAFDQMRLLQLKKYQEYLLCTLLILRRIKFAKQGRKGYAGFGKSEAQSFRKFPKFLRKISVLESLFE